MKAVLNVDGGARGNPGPAGIGVLLRSVSGKVLVEDHEYIGRATNNIAEYRALIFGIEKAAEAGVDEVEIVTDSELVARQICGEYKVKNVDLKPLFRDALTKLDGFKSWSIRSVPREENEEADALVNQALDAAID